MPEFSCYCRCNTIRSHIILPWENLDDGTIASTVGLLLICYLFLISFAIFVRLRKIHWAKQSQRFFLFLLLLAVVACRRFTHVHKQFFLLSKWNDRQTVVCIVFHHFVAIVNLMNLRLLLNYCIRHVSFVIFTVCCMLVSKCVPFMQFDSLEDDEFFDVTETHISNV